jgi:hypothetical protein
MAGSLARRLNLLGALFACVLLSQCAKSPSQSGSEFSGGLWWDGEKFAAKTFYSVNGVLSSRKPDRVDSTLNLQGKFVVPPFADAHVHNLNDDDSINDDIHSDLVDGVFYAMEMDPAIELTPKTLGSVNKPSSVDVSYTQGLVTPSWGIMADMYAMLAKMGRFGDRKTLAQVDTREVFLIDSKADLQKKWPALAAKNHDFIKVIIAFSEEQAMRRGNPRYGGKPPEYSAKPGIDPEVLTDLVQRAHDAGLRVAAHIETAADFRLAVDSGVDIIAHLPAAWQIGPRTGFTDGSLEHWKLTVIDAQKAAAKGVIVETTIVKAPKDPDADKYREVYRHNLQLLAQSGARIAIGCDTRGSVPEEAFYLSSLGVFGNQSMLNILTRATPQAIFPARKIGELRDGYEANFLALDGDPVQNLENIKHISLRVKAGNVINLGPGPAPSSGTAK